MALRQEEPYPDEEDEMLRTSLALGLLLAAPAAAQPMSDQVAHGAALAERWCAHCHVAGPEGRGTDAVPPLATVAQARQPDWLRAFLAKPHGAMPDLSLTTAEIEALTSYLDTLR